MHLSRIILIPILLASGGTWTRAADSTTMEAVVVVGGKATVQSVPRPDPGTGQVRVRVRAAGANPVDWNNPREGSIPGFDAAGVVDAIGTGVSDWKVGDEVIVFSDRTGAYAQYVVVPTSGLARKPASLSFAEAAGIPTVAYAAWWALVDAANVQPGQRVLIHGASGGTGSSAVQIAKARGAYVIASASTRNQEYLRSLGADETIDYTKERFEDRIKEPVDVVFNNVNAETATRSIAVTKRGGIIASISGAADAAMAQAAGVRAVTRGRGTPIADIMTQIAAWASEGKYKVDIDATYPMSNVEQAWADGREGHTRGKRIILID